jgi:DNA-binding Lrp family transcriptional regulator
MRIIEILAVVHMCIDRRRSVELQNRMSFFLRKRNVGISEAYRVCGIYDILVKVEAQTMDKVSKVVNHRLKNLKNNKSTLTMVAIRNS